MIEIVKCLTASIILLSSIGSFTANPIDVQQTNASITTSVSVSDEPLELKVEDTYNENKYGHQNNNISPDVSQCKS